MFTSLDDEVRRVGLDGLERQSAVRGGDDLVPCVGDRHTEHLEQGRVVVDKQDARHPEHLSGVGGVFWGRTVGTPSHIAPVRADGEEILRRP